PPFLPLLFLPFALLHLPLPVGKILILAGTPALFLALPPLDLGLIKRLVGWIKLHQPVQIFLSPVPLGEVGESCPGPEQLYLSRLFVCAVDRLVSGLVQPTAPRSAQPEIAESSSDRQLLTQRVPLGKLHRPAIATEGLCRLPGVLLFQSQLRYPRIGQQNKLILWHQGVGQTEQRRPLQKLRRLL